MIKFSDNITVNIENNDPDMSNIFQLNNNDLIYLFNFFADYYQFMDISKEKDNWRFINTKDYISKIKLLKIANLIANDLLDN